MDGYCDAEEGVANDDSGEGGCVEEEEDSEMLGESSSRAPFPSLFGPSAVPNNILCRHRRVPNTWLAFWFKEHDAALEEVYFFSIA